MDGILNVVRLGRVLDVTCESTERLKRDLTMSTKPITDGLKETQKKEEGTSLPTSNEPGDTRQSKCSNFGEQTRGSKLRWRMPKNVREFTSQVNAVATKVLNGELDTDTARIYASLTRVLAQSLSVEVTKARFLKTAPDMNIDDWDSIIESDGGNVMGQPQLTLNGTVIIQITGVLGTFQGTVTTLDGHNNKAEIKVTHMKDATGKWVEASTYKDKILKDGDYIVLGAAAA